MAGTIMLGAIFKTPTSSHRAGFTRSYPHRVIIKKISSNALVPTKTWLPNRVYIFNTVGSPTLFLFSKQGYSSLLSPVRVHQNYYSSPGRNHKSPAGHLQDKIKQQNHKDLEIYFLK